MTVSHWYLLSKMLKMCRIYFKLFNWKQTNRILCFAKYVIVLKNVQVICARLFFDVIWFLKFEIKCVMLLSCPLSLCSTALNRNGDGKIFSTQHLKGMMLMWENILFLGLPRDANLRENYFLFCWNFFVQDVDVRRRALLADLIKKNNRIGSGWIWANVQLSRRID